MMGFRIINQPNSGFVQVSKDDAENTKKTSKPSPTVDLTLGNSNGLMMSISQAEHYRAKLRKEQSS